MGWASGGPCRGGNNPLPPGERVARRAGEGVARGGASGTRTTRGLRVAVHPAHAQPPHPDPLPRGERGNSDRCAHPHCSCIACWRPLRTGENT
ncbi:hypothetical protein D9621_17440 [Azospirillum brasilense]|nr:hypothetical protein D9621_17440 [Azospirillum brasilense]